MPHIEIEVEGNDGQLIRVIMKNTYHLRGDKESEETIAASINLENMPLNHIPAEEVADEGGQPCGREHHHLIYVNHALSGGR